MPTTYNGIGTHYYGKKNRSTRRAICRACAREGALESYDTRLWFVVLFIPVIPLGRKRIIDQCPACTRHMAADAGTFEQARQLQTSGSLERFRREPSPEAALEAHAQLLAFHEHDQAASFCAAALDRFPDDAALRAGLAFHLDQVASYDEAAALYEAALAMQPDLPLARVGNARRKLALGELDEARKLLDFLEAPGAGQHQNLGPLEILAGAFQQQGRHEEALDLAAILLRELPPLGQHHAFRAFVSKSEQALRRPETILPPREHSLRGLLGGSGPAYAPWQRRLLAGGVGLLLLAAGLLINNAYIRRHRTLHVVNACGPPVQVRVDDRPRVAVAGLGKLTVGEGRHRVHLGGPVDETHEVVLHAGFFDRWFKKPLWVLNPGGEAVLDERTVSYAQNPRPSRDRLILGVPFVAWPHVDYRFEDPPDQLRVKKRDGEIVKSAVAWLQGQDTGAFLEAVATDREKALTFAERRLRRNPDQRELLEGYLQKTVADARPRAVAFLRAGLDRRPVVVEWHRAYQSSVGDVGGLVSLYDRFLAAEPENGALLYLRGRIEPDRGREEEFLRRAIDADPKSPWPWLALGVQAVSAARWDESLPPLHKALELGIAPDLANRPLHVARVAAGDGEGLVRDYRARLAAHAPDPETMVFLCDALAATGQPGQIPPALTAWIGRLPVPVQTQVGAQVRALGLYIAGELAACERLCGENALLRSGAYRVQTLLALGRAPEVAADGSFEPAWENPWNTLAVSLGLDLAGRPEEAARWRERACATMDSLSAETRRAAKVLRSAEPTPVGDLARIHLDPGERALILAVLGQRFPAQRAEYVAQAGRFNVRHTPPYHLVRRALDGEAPGAR